MPEANFCESDGHFLFANIFVNVIAVRICKQLLPAINYHMYKKYVAAHLTILMGYNYQWNVSIICKRSGQTGLFLMYILACCVTWYSVKSIIP